MEFSIYDNLKSEIKEISTNIAFSNALSGKGTLISVQAEYFIDTAWKDFSSFSISLGLRKAE